MVEHYTRSTVEVSVWCAKCRKQTRHSVSDRRQGSCLVCLERLTVEKDDREFAFEERAAIMEYDGNLPRLEAEFKATADVQKILGKGRQKGLFDGDPSKK